MTRVITFWRSWTLLRQLVIGVSAVVMVVLVAAGVTSVLSLRGSVLGIIDAQLSGSADGFGQAVTKYRIMPDAVFVVTAVLSIAGALALVAYATAFQRRTRNL